MDLRDPRRGVARRPVRPGRRLRHVDASRTVFGTLRSEIRPNHDGIGVADILKINMLSEEVVDAFEGGCKKRPTLGAHNLR